MIIGINGYAGSGKDTIGVIIQYLNSYRTASVTLEELVADYKINEWWLEEQSGWKIKKWAGKLKFIASILTGIPTDQFEDQEFKHTNLGPEWTYKKVKDGGELFDSPMTVREFLQRLGTDGLRQGLHENTWVNALMSDYRCVPADRAPGGWDCDNWIITDTRFPNEAQAIKDAGGIIIRVDRPGVKAINTHSSETALDNWDFDHKVWNGSDMVALMFTVHGILKQHNLSRYADYQAKNQDAINP